MGRTITLAAALMLALITPTAAPSRAHERCQVTLPNGNAPAAESPVGHGNEELATALWPAGVVRPRPEWMHADGSIHIKWPWYRLAVTGDLSVTGRRLDADAPPLRAEIAAGYGLTGFQATAITFPTAGCWEVTGSVGNASLTFVTLVLRPGQAMPDTATGEAMPIASAVPAAVGVVLAVLLLFLTAVVGAGSGSRRVR